MYSCSGTLNEVLPGCVGALSGANGISAGDQAQIADGVARHRSYAAQPDEDAIAVEGLLHDARNLVGTLGLYCDLLSKPDVLKPEHRHYAEEVRLLGARSGALIEQLMEHRTQPRWHGGLRSPMQSPVLHPGMRPGWPEGWTRAGDSGIAVKPLSLRSIVERCSGLLSRVAGGKPIEVSYGAAAAVQVLVAEEAVERILVNLVRNAAAALGAGTTSQRLIAYGARKTDTSMTARAPADVRGDAAGTFGGDDTKATSSFRETVVDPTEDINPFAIRIGVGLLINRVGDPKPWPFRRVRLVVEDSGCGMTAEQVEWLLCGSRSPSRGNHGIGFRVVRELVAGSEGDLRVMSAPGIGTRVQIEWPLAGLAQLETREHGSGAGDEAQPSPPKDAETPRWDAGQPEESLEPPDVATKKPPLPEPLAADAKTGGRTKSRRADAATGTERWSSC